MNKPTALEDRVLAVQKDVKKLKDAAYADHRLIEKLNNQHIALLKTVTNLVEILQDDHK